MASGEPIGAATEPAAGVEGAQRCPMKVGEASQRLQCARVLAEIYATLDYEDTGDIADAALEIAREAAASLVLPKPRG